MKQREVSGAPNRRLAVRAAIHKSATTAQGDTYRNFGDGFSRAFELAVTPVIFGAMGYFLDGRMGIRPVFTIVFALLAVIGLLLRTWFGYVHRMEALEEAGPWAKQT